MKVSKAIKNKYMIKCLLIKAKRYAHNLQFEELKEYLHKIRNIVKVRKIYLQPDIFLVVYEDEEGVDFKFRYGGEKVILKTDNYYI